jgi:hypothetical protein
MRVFMKTVVTVPPRVTFGMPLQVALRILRSLESWRLVRALAPGRVLVGKRG